MAKGSSEQGINRRDEIVDACARLYGTMEFRDIGIKSIAELTSFTRPSIYNYFETKEEIFLALLQRDYESWTSDLESLRPLGSGDPEEKFADSVARTLASRERLLRLLSTNTFEMEENCRMENLVEFKRAYGSSVKALRECLLRFVPDMETDEAEAFVSSFLPLVYGTYPYAVVSEKKREAMDEAGVEYTEESVYTITRRGALMLLKGRGKGER